jgi:hypothetical protein
MRVCWHDAFCRACVRYGLLETEFPGCVVAEKQCKKSWKKKQLVRLDAHFIFLDLNLRNLHGMAWSLLLVTCISALPGGSLA